MKKSVLFVLIGGAAVLAPAAAHACACGCGVFDVATSEMFPHDSGGMLYTEFAFQDQDRNWSHTGPASASGNGDKDLRTDFTTTGLQYMFNRKWGVQVEIPYDIRDFKTLGGATGNEVVRNVWGALGDVRLEGLYTGFNDDMATGLEFGFKFPTGNWTHNDAWQDIDRDSEIGTGSTDLLLGGFHQHKLTRNNDWIWYGQALVDVPFLTQAQYHPGTELDTALGVYYKGWYFHGVTLIPLGQVIGSVRTSDYGNFASGGVDDPPTGERDSGYERIMLSPGIEVKIHPFSFYADVELPVFQDFNGNQLAAPFLFKFIASITF